MGRLSKKCIYTDPLFNRQGRKLTTKLAFRILTGGLHTPLTQYKHPSVGLNRLGTSVEVYHAMLLLSFSRKNCLFFWKRQPWVSLADVTLLVGVHKCLWNFWFKRVKDYTKLALMIFVFYADRDKVLLTRECVHVQYQTCWSHVYFLLIVGIVLLLWR